MEEDAQALQTLFDIAAATIRTNDASWLRPSNLSLLGTRVVLAANAAAENPQLLESCVVEIDSLDTAGPAQHRLTLLSRRPADAQSALQGPVTHLQPLWDQQMEVMVYAIDGSLGIVQLGGTSELGPPLHLGGDVTGLSTHPQTGRVISGGSDGQAHVLAFGDHQMGATPDIVCSKNVGKTVTSVRWQPGGDHIASCTTIAGHFQWQRGVRCGAAPPRSAAVLDLRSDSVAAKVKLELTLNLTPGGPSSTILHSHDYLHGDINGGGAADTVVLGYEGGRMQLLDLRKMAARATVWDPDMLEAKHVTCLPANFNSGAGGGGGGGGAAAARPHWTCQGPQGASLWSLAAQGGGGAPQHCRALAAGAALDGGVALLPRGGGGVGAQLLGVSPAGRLVALRI
ncbi:hypothetical protein JKP88DRAFT_275684 [Tribonema minus]|uniref:Uncharacterized protein n=1 Tax=Tribonema minus TaxID=303371 RepID=A0A836CK77_9STRA|nr:hypothetical protein JKP88DRAFT_275684 [Tribonema minus]